MQQFFHDLFQAFPTTSTSHSCSSIVCQFFFPFLQECFFCLCILVELSGDNLKILPGWFQPIIWHPKRFLNQETLNHVSNNNPSKNLHGIAYVPTFNPIFYYENICQIWIKATKKNSYANIMFMKKTSQLLGVTFPSMAFFGSTTLTRF